MRLSAIMITGHQPERQLFALNAIECFKKQTVPETERELIIINIGTPLQINDENIREILVQRSSEVTLGDLRNLAFQLTKGEWMIQWDDDDWHHPLRCQVQLEMKSPHTEKCVLLGSQVRYNLLTKDHFIYTSPYGIAGTILHHRSVPWRYPSINKKEDSEFLAHFCKQKVILSRPELYWRIFHGLNTCSEKHIMMPKSEFRSEVALLNPNAIFSSLASLRE